MDGGDPLTSKWWSCPFPRCPISYPAFLISSCQSHEKNCRFNLSGKGGLPPPLPPSSSSSTVSSTSLQATAVIQATTASPRLHLVQFSSVQSPSQGFSSPVRTTVSMPSFASSTSTGATSSTISESTTTAAAIRNVPTPTQLTKKAIDFGSSAPSSLALLRSQSAVTSAAVSTPLVSSTSAPVSETDTPYKSPLSKHVAHPLQSLPSSLSVNLSSSSLFSSPTSFPSPSPSPRPPLSTPLITPASSSTFSSLLSRTATSTPNNTRTVQTRRPQPQILRRPRVLLGLSGSVASIKAEELVKSIAAFADVKIVYTAHAQHFFVPEDLQLIRPASSSPRTLGDLGLFSEEGEGEGGGGPSTSNHSNNIDKDQDVGTDKEKAPPQWIYSDADEWQSWQKLGDPVVHIELRKWADVLLIAPLSANTLAKITHGLCDNLLTCVVRAWDIGKKPLLLAPAMNTLMYEHPLTTEQLGLAETTLRATVIPPQVKLLACKEKGIGALAPVDAICVAIMHAIKAVVKAQREKTL